MSRLELNQDVIENNDTIKIIQKKKSKKVNAKLIEITNEKMEFITKLTNLLLSERRFGYNITNNFDKNMPWTKADIVIFSEFSCNVYDEKTRCWDNCYKCHLHYGCNISNEICKLCDEYNYHIEWIDCVTAGFYEKKF